jgi:DNA polymerase-1
MKDLLLIDVNAIFCRSRSALTRAMGEMVTSAGIPVTGTYGTINTILSVIEKGDYDSVIPCYDAGGNFRKKLDESYKGTREKSSIEHYADMSLLVEDVLPTLGFSPVGVKGYEADDILATISRNSPAYREVHILTVDADLLQLAGNRVKIILFNSVKKTKVYGIDEVLEKYGVYPAEVKYWKALAGDSSDNVAGIKGIGPKTATKIIEECRPNEINPEFSGADRICLHPKVAPHAGTFLANLRLTTLENDVPNLQWFASSPPIPLHVEALFQGLEFRSLLKRKVKILETLGCK